MRQVDELDELARLLRLHGARVVRVAQGVMVALDRQTDAARAYVVLVASWPGSRRWLAWGPVRSMRSPAADVEGAALELLTHLWEAPLGHQPPAWPDPIRDYTGAGRIRSRLRRLRARLNARPDARLDTRLNARADARLNTQLNARADTWIDGRPDIWVCGRAIARVVTRFGGRGGGRGSGRPDGRASGRFAARVRGRW